MAWVHAHPEYATTWSARHRKIVEAAQRLDAQARQLLDEARRHTWRKTDLEAQAESLYEQSVAMLQGILLYGHCEGEA